MIELIAYFRLYWVQIRKIGGMSCLFILVSVLFGVTEGVGIGLLAPLLDAAGPGNSFDDVPVIGSITGLLEGYSTSKKIVISVSGLAIVVFVRAILQFLQLALLAWIPSRLGMVIANDTVHRVVGANIQFMNARKLGEHANAITALSHECAQIIGVLSRMTSLGIVLVAYVAIMIMISPIMAFAAIGLIGFVGLLIRSVAGVPASRAAAKYISATIEYSNYLFEMLSGSQLVRLNSAEHIVIKKQDNLLRDRQRKWLVQQLWMALPGVTLTVAVGAMICGMVIILALRNEGDAGGWLPAVLLFIALLFRMLAPTSEITTLYTRLVTLLPASARLHKYVVDASLHKQPSGNLVLDPGFRSRISFEGVSFSYDAETTVLSDLNFEIKNGDRIALVGPSGGGKSTIVNLLVRLYEVESGTIWIDGKDIRELDTVAWRDRIGFVSQDPYFFNDTVRNNLVFGLEDGDENRVDEQDLRQAAKQAEALKFIESLPQGFDTHIADRGVRLSGGQRQRLAIARALLRKPDLLILDEATSQLDGLVQDELGKTLERLPHSMTVVTIAHRLSTVISSDRILVVDGGRIVGEGKHEQLLKSSELYQRLIKTQELAA